MSLTAFDIALQFISDFLLVAFCCITSKRKAQNRESVAITILSGIANDGHAIAILCRSGLDVQARSLLRGFVEKIDLFVTTALSDDIADEYIRDSTFEGSRNFYFAKVSKGRLRTSARSLFKKFLSGQQDWADWLWVEWRPELELMVGAAVHPNHTVGMISLFPNLGRGRASSIGIGGHPTRGSLRTIREAFMAMSAIAMLVVPGGIHETYTGWQNVEQDSQDQLLRGAKFTLSFMLAEWLANAAQ